MRKRSPVSSYFSAEKKNTKSKKSSQKVNDVELDKVHPFNDLSRVLFFLPMTGIYAVPRVHSAQSSKGKSERREKKKLRVTVFGRVDKRNLFFLASFLLCRISYKPVAH